MTQSLMARDRAEAKKKGLVALSAWVGSGILFYLHAPVLGLLGVAGGTVPDLPVVHVPSPARHALLELGPRSRSELRSGLDEQRRSLLLLPG